MDGLTCSISVASFMALELFLDMFIRSNSKVDDKFERFVIIFLAFFPSLMTRIAPDDQQLGYVYASWHAFQVCGFVGPVLSLGCKYVPSYFKTVPSVAAYFFWCVSGVLSILNFGQNLNSLFFIFSSLSSLVSGVLFVYELYPWLQNLRNRFYGAPDIDSSSLLSKLFGIMSEGEIHCFLYWIIFLCMCVTFPIAFGIRHYFQWDDIDIIGLCGFVYSNTTFSILIGLVPGRVQQHMLNLNE